MQTIQEVFVVEEWVNEAWNEAKTKANLRPDVDKALGLAEQENKEIATRLIEEEKGRRSAEAELKNAKTQVEEQRKKPHYNGIKLAIA